MVQRSIPSKSLATYLNIMISPANMSTIFTPYFPTYLQLRNIHHLPQVPWQNSYLYLQPRRDYLLVLHVHLGPPILDPGLLESKTRYHHKSFHRVLASSHYRNLQSYSRACSYQQELRSYTHHGCYIRHFHVFSSRWSLIMCSRMVISPQAKSWSLSRSHSGLLGHHHLCPCYEGFETVALRSSACPVKHCNIHLWLPICICSQDFIGLPTGPKMPSAPICTWSVLAMDRHFLVYRQSQRGIQNQDAATNTILHRQFRPSCCIEYRNCHSRSIY